jgi:hypothetical protein
MATCHPFTPATARRAAAAAATLVAGHLLLAVPPAEGVVSLTLAPLLLAAGYGVLVPWAILGSPRSS